MKVKTMLTVALAAMFVLGSFVVIMDSEESDATSAGATNIFIYNGSTWADYLAAPGYNALQALQSTGVTIEADTDYILEKENDWGPYTEINSDYGKVSSIGGLSETSDSVWNVFTYNNGAWSVGIDAIGFITPFTDGAAPSANVVFFYGADATSVHSEVSTHVGSNIADLISPATIGASAIYTFNLKITADGYSPTIAPGTTVMYMTASGIASKVLTADDLTAGITLVGVGSNAYAALKNAVGSNNIQATETAGAYYGWLGSLFGLTTQSSGSDYIYWTQNTASGGYLSYNLGAYSGQTDVSPGQSNSNESFIQTAFALEYVLYSYS